MSSINEQCKTLADDNEKNCDLVHKGWNKEENGKLLNNCSKTKETTDLDSSDSYVSLGFIEAWRTDPEYRLKFLTFLALVWSFFILGWKLSQFGPSLYDLQLITGTDLEEASIFYTSHNVGYLVGSLVSGVLIGRCDCNFLLFVTMIMYGVSSTAIPWSSQSVMMLTAQALRGLAGGLLDTVANSELLSLYGNKVSPYMQAMHFSFAVGGIVSPLVMAPFLAVEDNADSQFNNSSRRHETMYSNITHNANVLTMPVNHIQLHNGSLNHQFNSLKNPEKSEVYIPYSMSGFLAFSSAVSFIILYFKSRRLFKKREGHQETERNERKLTIMTKLIILTILSIIFLLYTAMEDTIGAFVATFCVEQMRMTKTEGSYVTSFFWSFFAFGRLTGILAGKLLRSIPLVTVYTLSLIISFLLLSFAPLIESQIVVWVSTGITGIGLSILFPVLFTWTEEDFLLVTGKIASLFIVMSTAGSITSPSILGYLIEEVSSMWYAYILLIESLGVLFFFGIAVLLKKKLPQLKDTQNRTLQIEISVNQETNPTKESEPLTNLSI